MNEEKEKVDVIGENEELDKSLETDNVEEKVDDKPSKVDDEEIVKEEVEEEIEPTEESDTEKVEEETVEEVVEEEKVEEPIEEEPTDNPENFDLNEIKNILKEFKDELNKIKSEKDELEKDKLEKEETISKLNKDLAKTKKANDFVSSRNSIEINNNKRDYTVQDIKKLQTMI